MFDNTSFTQQLQTALDDTVREFNKSRDPDAAVAKVACDFGFTPSGTQRLVETFNRARTIFHFTTSEDKTAEFRLADPEQVAKLMYSPEAPVKEASVLEGIALQGFYEGPEQDYAHTPAVLFSEKVAEAEPLPVENLHARITQQRNWFSKAAEVAKNLYDTSSVYISREASALANQMLMDAKDADRLRTKFAEYSEACRRDPEISPVVEKVAEQFSRAYRLDEPVTIKFASVMDTAGIDKYLVATARIAGYLQKQAMATAVAEGIQKDAAVFEESVNTLFYGQREDADPDFLLKRGASAGSASDKPKPADKDPEQRPWLNIGESGGLLDTVSRGATFQAGKGMSGYIDADLFRSTTGAPIERENKELTSIASNVHRQLMLEDLLTNDPVLSAADPNSVINAYQGLLNLAPDVANQRPTVVAILRQAIHAQDAYSPYDADQLVRLNTALKNVKGVPAAEKKLEIKP